MDKKKELQNDRLRQYINPGMMQKAPEGFTSRVMSQVSTLPLQVTQSREKPGKIPFVSSLVIIFLTGLAVSLPHTNGSRLPSFADFNKFSGKLPDFDLSSLLRINLPSTIFYVFIGIFLLFLFDRGLKQVFHSKN